MSEECVSVDSGYSAAVMATRWISEFRAVQHPQADTMTTTLIVAHKTVHLDMLSTVQTQYFTVLRQLWSHHEGSREEMVVWYLIWHVFCYRQAWLITH